VGVLETIGLLILVSIAGTWLLKQQGSAAWLRLQETLARGEMPTTEVVDGALILFGGALLLTPGFLTDVVGLTLLLPPTRAVVKRVAVRFLGRMARRRFGVPRIYNARVVRRVRDEEPTRPVDPSPEELPPAGDGADEGGSPGTG
jgi:UPF0716 protein FxsA